MHESQRRVGEKVREAQLIGIVEKIGYLVDQDILVAGGAGDWSALVAAEGGLVKTDESHAEEWENEKGDWIVDETQKQEAGIEDC